MLKSGYFTTRKEIIDWINSTLLLNITKIEQLGAGNIYCHILDAAFPAKVPMHKVKWNAQTEIDFLFNFKILQNCFEHLGIARHIEVPMRPLRSKNLWRRSIRTTWSSFSGWSSSSASKSRTIVATTLPEEGTTLKFASPLLTSHTRIRRISRLPISPTTSVTRKIAIFKIFPKHPAFQTFPSKIIEKVLAISLTDPQTKKNQTNKSETPLWLSASSQKQIKPYSKDPNRCATAEGCTQSQAEWSFQKDSTRNSSCRLTKKSASDHNYFLPTIIIIIASIMLRMLRPIAFIATAALHSHSYHCSVPQS